MNIQFKGFYRSSGKYNPNTAGKERFSYEVVGTKEELADFKASRGEYYIENENGAPLLNLLEYVGDRVALIKLRDGRYIPDTSNFEKMASLARKHGGNIGQEFAKLAAAQLMGTSATTAKVEAKDPAADFSK